MAHEHIARLKQDTLAMTALAKAATGEPLNAKEREVIAELAKQEALERRLRERYDLAGAIEKCLRGVGQSTGPALPAQEVETAKASGDTLDAAIASAFDRPATVSTNELAGQTRDAVVKNFGTGAGAIKKARGTGDPEAEARAENVKKFRERNSHLYHYREKNS